MCGTDYCYAPSTATAPATVCGEAGYVACGIAEGGMFFLENERVCSTNENQAAAVLRATHVKSMAVALLLVFLTPRPVVLVRTSVQHQLGTGVARADLLAESVPATPPLLRRSS